MANRTEQKDKSSDFQKWSSPRLRSSANAIKDSERTTDDSDGHAVEQPSTPEQSSSNQKRELRKLEDYWTRHNPVKEDSPRLRSNRKQKFEVQESLNKSKNLIKSQMCVLPRSERQAVSDLSESPFPGEQQKGINVSSTPSSSMVSESALYLSSPNIFSKFADASAKIKFEQEVKTECMDLVETPLLTNQPTTIQETVLLTELTINYLPDSQNSEQSFDYLSGTQSTTDGLDSDAPDYMPPRKKLRSQVSKEELWEGIPLGISFKRLAPLSKKPEPTSSNDEDRYDNIADDMNSGGFISLQRSPLESKGDIEVQSESSLESTIIYEETDSRDTFQDDYTPVKTKNSCIESIQHINDGLIISTQADDTWNELRDQSTPPGRKKRKLQLPQTPRKRSARLLEKSFAVTPDKAGQYLSARHTPTSPPCTNHTSLIPGDNLKPVGTRHKKDEKTTCDRDVLEEQPTVELNVIQAEEIIHEGDIPIGQNEEVVQTLESAVLLESEDADNATTHSSPRKAESVTHPISDDSLCQQTISQILDCEYYPSNSGFVNENTVHQLDERKSEVLENEIIDDGLNDEVIESVSKTLEYLLDSIDNSKELGENIANNQVVKVLSCAEVISKPESSVKDVDKQSCITADESKVKHRRSSRLAKIEKKSSPVKTSLPVDSEKIQESSTTAIEDQSDAVSCSSSVNQIHDDAELSHTSAIQNMFKKCNIKTKGSNKSVPPLRIRLKFPLKCLKENKNLPNQTKLNINNTTEKDVDNGNPSTSQSRDKKVKKKVKHSVKQRVEPPSKQGDKRNTGPDRKVGPGQKRGFTPVKGQKSKRYTKAPRRWSPTTNVDLRLNNERRVAAAGKILSNPLLDKHACVLWSSENRRHVQLSNAEATSAEVDELLRRKWETLSDKEKLKYSQRARDALRDENRHSNRHIGEAEQPSTSGSRQESTNPSLARFLSLDSKSQLAELKSRLHFYREVSPEEYNNIMTAYKLSCIEERQENELREIEGAKSKSKQKKNKRKSEDTHNAADTHAKYRKLLYEKVCENWSKVLNVWAEKKGAQKQILRDNYSTLVRRLIVGHSVEFSEHTTSARLSEALCDLRDLERDRKLAVAGFAERKAENKAELRRAAARNYPEICRPIKGGLLDGRPITGGLLDGLLDNVDHEALDQMVKEIPAGPLPIIDQQTLDEFVPYENDPQPCSCNLETGSNMTSPTSLLNDWVAQDMMPSMIPMQSVMPSMIPPSMMMSSMMMSNQNTEFRDAVSLLPNRFNQSHNYVVPQYVNEVYAQRETAVEHDAAGRNNNSFMNDQFVGTNMEPVHQRDNAVMMSPAKMYNSVKTVYNQEFKIKQILE